MSEVYKYYLQLVEKIRDLVNNKFSDEMEKKPDLQGLTPDKQREVLKNHSDKIRAEVLNVISKAQPEIESKKTSTQRDRRLTLYPGLYSSEDNKKQMGLQQQSNALMTFQMNWDKGNFDSLINSIQNAIETKQYDFASTIFDQIRNSKSTDDIHDTIKKTANELEKVFHKTIGIDVYDEKLRILDYADKLSQASTVLVERSEFSGDERLYLPEYGSKEFQDKMILANIESTTGVEFITEPSIGGEAVASVSAAAAE